MKNTGSVVAILFGKGGLGDIGRHAVLAALQRDDVSQVKVLSENPETLEEPNWKCGCTNNHFFTDEQRERMEIIPVTDNWKNITSYLQNVDAVCVSTGTRQPFLGARGATAASKAVVEAMQTHGISRVVSVTSIGLNEDYPSLEFHWAGKIMDGLFATICRREAKDLIGSENIYKDSDVDYLLVRPMGLAEDKVPNGEWFIQKEKHKDVIGTQIAKMDVGSFLVEEALNPSRHGTAVVVGSDPDKDEELQKILAQRKAKHAAKQ